MMMGFEMDPQHETFDWRAECANYRGVALRRPPNIDSDIRKIRATWIAADLAPKIKTPKDRSKTIQIIGDGAKVVTFEANGVEPVSGDDHDPLGECVDLGQVSARCLQRRYTTHGAVYVWETVPGGRFDRFQTIGLPDEIAEAR